MYYALVNKQTKKVENVVVPPQGSNMWFVGEGYDAVLTDSAKIGDVYDNGEFSTPAAPM